MTRFILVAALVGCGSQSAQEPSAVESHEQPTATPGHDEADDETSAADPRELCLPLVNGCGCSSMCAQGERHVGFNQYMITHDGQDSRLDQARRGRLCFDARGVSSPDDGTRSGCVDTFQWGVCGGECIPTPVPICRIVDGSCVRVDEEEHAASWENATFRVSFSADVPSGTLRLLGNRYEYVGDAAPAGSGEAFYFAEHPTGVLSVEVRDDPRTVGLVHFDPDGPGYEPMDSRRTLQVRREDGGTYWMHSIVSEFQVWSIRSE